MMLDEAAGDLSEDFYPIMERAPVEYVKEFAIGGVWLAGATWNRKSSDSPTCHSWTSKGPSLATRGRLIRLDPSADWRSSWASARPDERVQPSLLPDCRG